MGIRGSWDHPRCADLLECTELTIQLLSLLTWMKGSKAEWAKENGTWSEVQGNWRRASKNSHWSDSGWNWVSSKELWQLVWCCPTRKLVNSQCQWLLWNDSEVVPTPHIPIFWAPGKKSGFSTNQLTELMQAKRATVISAGHSGNPWNPSSQTANSQFKVCFSGWSAHQLYHFPAQEF